MDNKIDARGMACPIPVIKAKKEAERGSIEFLVLVDNKTAVENLKRFGASNGYLTAIESKGQDFEVAFSKAEITGAIVAEYGGAVSAAAGAGNAGGEPGTDGSTDQACGCELIDEFKTYAVFVGREGIGEGSPELGASLLKMFFYTLAQDSDIPRYILFMNAGVKVPVDNEQVTEHLKALEEMGSEILVCGTCLNYYDIAAGLRIGTVSNMYDIAKAMKSVDKVITL